MVYRDRPSSAIHLALIKGIPSENIETLVRVHEPATVLDLLDTAATTHSWPLAKALQTLAAAPVGVAVLLNVAGISAPNDVSWLERFQKLTNAPPNKALQRKPDFRSYGIGAQILKDLQVGKMRLLGNPGPTPSLSGYKLEITGHTPFAD